VFAILLMLAEGSRHGYAIMKKLRETSAERLPPGPATLYRTLKEMQGDGLITSTKGDGEESDGPPRRYYKLTGFGKRVAAAEAARMRSLAHHAGELLAGS
jgi:DNA-binding PadR family transcriptional regulator